MKIPPYSEFLKASGLSDAGKQVDDLIELVDKTKGKLREGTPDSVSVLMASVIHSQKLLAAYHDWLTEQLKADSEK